MSEGVCKIPKSYGDYEKLLDIRLLLIRWYQSDNRKELTPDVLARIKKVVEKEPSANKERE